MPHWEDFSWETEKLKETSLSTSWSVGEMIFQQKTGNVRKRHIPRLHPGLSLHLLKKQKIVKNNIMRKPVDSILLLLLIKIKFLKIRLA